MLRGITSLQGIIFHVAPISKLCVCYGTVCGKTWLSQNVGLKAAKHRAIVVPPSNSLSAALQGYHSYT